MNNKEHIQKLTIETNHYKKEMERLHKQFNELSGKYYDLVVDNGKLLDKIEKLENQIDKLINKL